MKVVRAQGDWIIELAVGKFLLASYYGDAVWVPERFPPLSRVAKEWTHDKLLAELSTHVQPYFRDRILIGEMISRNPSESQLMDVLEKFRTHPALVEVRLGQILNAMSEEDKSLSRVKRFAESCLEVLARMGATAEDAGVEAFRWIDCSDRLEQRVVGLLGKRSLLKGGLQFLGRCAVSGETYRFVDGMDVPHGMEQFRSTALVEFRKRHPTQTAR